MITAIREHAVVKNGGIVIPETDLPDGTEVEILVLVGKDMDETEYLLSSEANKEHLFRSIKEAREQPERLITFESVDELKNYFLRNDGI